MNEIKIYKDNEKLQEAYEKFSETMVSLINEYQLSYFELLGIFECIKCDIIEANMGEKENEENN